MTVRSDGSRGGDGADGLADDAEGVAVFTACAEEAVHERRLGCTCKTRALRWTASRCALLEVSHVLTAHKD